MNCPKCNSKMWEGWLLNQADNYGLEIKWIDGIPQSNWLGSRKYDKNSAISVQAFRCTSCGFLELYAND